MPDNAQPDINNYTFAGGLEGQQGMGASVGSGSMPGLTAQDQSLYQNPTGFEGNSSDQDITGDSAVPTGGIVAPSQLGLRAGLRKPSEAVLLAINRLDSLETLRASPALREAYQDRPGKWRDN